ncbi:MAG: cyclodeaminase/cyclohydrolase family protein [Chloroflexi bacterium]|nr:cyclodeaminase/cyclohydrolase family protein [Chloroflexota bacterium]
MPSRKWWPVSPSGKKKYAAVQDKAENSSGQKRPHWGAQLTQAIRADMEAFDRVMAVYRDKSLAAEAQTEALETATIGAGEVPLQVARFSRDVALLAQEIAQIGNVNAITDAASAAFMAVAAVQAAASMCALTASIYKTGNWPLPGLKKWQTWWQKHPKLRSKSPPQHNSAAVIKP